MTVELACTGAWDGGAALPLRLHHALFAGGMLGIYQVDIEVPTSARGWVQLRCGQGTQWAVGQVPVAD